MSNNGHSTMQRNITFTLNIALIILATSTLIACQSSPSNQATPMKPPSASIETQRYNPDTLIVSYQPEQKTQVITALKKYNVEIIYQYNIINSVAIRIPQGSTLENIQKDLEKIDGVIAVQKDHILELQ